MQLHSKFGFFISKTFVAGTLRDYLLKKSPLEELSKKTKQVN